MTKILNFKQFKITTAALVISFLLFPVSTLAVKLYLEPAEGEYQASDVFVVDIKIDTEGECINTIEAEISFSQDILKAIDFNKGNSILILWVKEPNFSVVSCDEPGDSCGLLSFSGGIPGGYCGRIPGDPGPSDSLGKMIFRVHRMIVEEPGKNLAEIKFLTTSQVLLNDGLGTKAKLDTRGAVFEIIEKLESPKDEWQEEIKKDNILPEPFEIEICQESAIFEGKYFVTFFTVDKQTGVDYYEIKEGKKDWKKIESPYLLEYQTLQSIIKVKAVDKAGNERIAEYLPSEIKKPFPYWLIILITFGIIIWGIWQKIFKK